MKLFMVFGRANTFIRILGLHVSLLIYTPVPYNTEVVIVYHISKSNQLPRYHFKLDHV